MKHLPFQKLTILALTAGVLQALAQVTTPPPATATTCTTAPTTVTAFNIEQTLDLTKGIFTTATPTIPANLQSAFLSGALQPREQFVYNPTNNTIRVTAFGAAPGSTSPTSPANILASNTAWVFDVAVDKIYTSCKPSPSLMFVGTITSNYPNSPFGDLTGAVIAISTGYTTDSPAKINNVVVNVAGLAGLYTASASGTVTFPSTPVTPPGSAANAPVVVIANGANQTTSSKQLVLDASGSTSPLNLQLSYAWSQVSTNQSVAISNANTATPLITFAGGKDTYLLQVVVTDSKGNSTTQQVMITYTGL